MGTQRDAHKKKGKRPMKLYTPPLAMLIAIGLIIGEPVDIAISTIAGGQGKTISARTAKSALEDNAAAYASCVAYTPVLAHDVVRFSPGQIKWMAEYAMRHKIDLPLHCRHRYIAEYVTEYREHFQIDESDDWDNLNR